MVETIFQFKRSPGSSSPGSLLFGEPAWVEATNTLYIGKSDGSAIGIPFGVSYQPFNARLNELSSLSPTNGSFLAGNGSSFVLQSGASARSLLGLGSAAIASTTDFVGAAEKGAAGGVATLDGTGKVPASQLSPTYIPVVSVFGRTGPIAPQAGDYTAAQVGALAIANNLSDIPSATAARTNLGLGSAATANTAFLLDRANHTGTQAVSTVAGLQTALDSKLSGSELDDHLSAPVLDHPDGSVTDIKIGNRTITDTLIPTGLGPGSLTQWLEWIVNRIKAITGRSNWWETPATTLQATASHLANTSNPHNVTASQVGAIATTEKGVANGVATLDSAGKIPTAQIPPIAIKETFPVNSEAEMLALTAEVGDVAIRLDTEQSFVLRLPGPSTLSNWQEMLTKTAVTSVFGRTGVVGAQAGDYTTDQVTERGNLYYTDARVNSHFATKNTGDLAEGASLYFTIERSRNALAATGPLAYNPTTGTFSIPAASASQDGYLSSANWNKLAALGTISTQNSDAIAITGGAINGTAIGETTPATGSFTNLTAEGNANIGGNAYVAGNLIVTGSISSGGVTARASSSVTTPAIANDADDALTLTPLGKAFLLLNIGTSASARVRIYRSEAYRVADLARAIGTDPTGEHGLILDAVLTAENLDLDLAPIIWGATCRTDDHPVATITNLSGTPQAITINLLALNFEGEAVSQRASTKNKLAFTLTALESYGYYSGTYSMGAIADGDTSFGVMVINTEVVKICVTFSLPRVINEIKVYRGQFNGNYHSPNRMRIYAGASDTDPLMYTSAPMEMNSYPQPVTIETFAGSVFDSPRTDYTFVFDNSGTGMCSIRELEVYGY